MNTKEEKDVELQRRIIAVLKKLNCKGLLCPKEFRINSKQCLTGRYIDAEGGIRELITSTPVMKFERVSSYLAVFTTYSGSRYLSVVKK